MTYGQIDEIDIVSLIALPLFAGIVLGVWELSLNLFSFSFSDALVTIGGEPITLAMIGALASIGFLASAGYLNSDDYADEEWYVIAGSLAILPIYRFVPAVRDLFAYSDFIPFTVWVLVSAAAIYISYKG